MVSLHANVYEPFQSRSPGHEDALTRAFLIVLRAVPVAHAAWLSLVRRGHLEADQTPRHADGRVPELYDLPVWAIDTQTQRVSEDVGRVISVLQTDEPYFLERDLKASTRNQVLDGTVTYGDELTIVVENKLAHGKVWEGQLEVNVPGGVEHDPRLSCVQWRDVVQSWARLLQVGALAPAEQVLVGDFLDFTERYFPRLQPFATVRMCGHDRFRLERRARWILEATKLAPVERAAGWGWYLDLPKDVGNVAIRVALIPHVDEKPRLELQVAPADKVQQARRFHERITLADLRQLEQRGWVVEPNFHLSFMQSHVFYGSGTASIEDYVEFWTAHTQLIGRVPRANWDTVWAELRAAEIVSDGDRAAFDRAFTATARSFAVSVPGYLLRWSVPLREAADLDDREQLAPRLAAEAEAMGKVLGLRFSVGE